MLCFNYNIIKESFFQGTHLSGCCHAWTFSISMLPSSRNQSNHLQCKSIDKSIDCSLWGEPCHEKKLILFHFYFYLFTSFINAVKRNISYRYFLFFHITFIIIYHIVFIQKLLKLGAIFASNSNTMFIFTRFLSSFLLLQKWSNIKHEWITAGDSSSFISISHRRQPKQAFNLQKQILSSFFLMIIKSQKGVCQ